MSRVLARAHRRSIWRNTVCSDGAMQLELQRCAGGIVLTNRKRARVVITGMIQGDLLADIGGTQETASCSGLLRWSAAFSRSIPTQGKMIEFVLEPSGAFPYPHTEAAGGRVTSGIHDFRSIAVPLNVSRIEYRSVGWVEGK